MTSLGERAELRNLAESGGHWRCSERESGSELALAWLVRPCRSLPTVGSAKKWRARAVETALPPPPPPPKKLPRRKRRPPKIQLSSPAEARAYGYPPDRARHHTAVWLANPNPRSLCSLSASTVPIADVQSGQPVRSGGAGGTASTDRPQFAQKGECACRYQCPFHSDSGLSELTPQSWLSRFGTLVATA